MTFFKARGIVLIWILVTGAVSAQMCPSNLVTNAGFEAWSAGQSGPPDDWSLGTTGFSASRESTNVFDGMYAVNLTWTSTTTQRFTQSVSGVNPGETYEVKIHVYDADTGGRVRLFCYWRDGSGDQVGTEVTSDYSEDDTVWTELTSGVVTAPPDAVSLEYTVRMYDVTGWSGQATVYVDDAEVCAVTVPTETPTPAPTATPSPTPGPPVLSPGDILINEFVYDPAGADDQREWVELFNTTASDVDIGGCRLEWAGTDWTYGSLTLPSFTVPAGGHLLLYESDVSPPSGALDLLVDFSPQLQNGGTDADGLRFVDAWGTVIDTVIYGGTANGNHLADDSGTEAVSFAPAAENDNALGRCPDGTDTNLSGDDFAVIPPWYQTQADVNDCTTPTPTPTIVPNPLYSLVINEVFVNPSGVDDDLEWIEIYNSSDEAVDVVGLVIQSTTELTTNAFEDRVVLPSMTVPAHGYLLVAEQLVDVTGVPPGTAIYQPGDPGLDLDFQNGADHTEGIRLVANTSEVIDTLIYSHPNLDTLKVPGDTPEDPDGAHPAPRPYTDQALARCPNGVDTNYCDADFIRRSGTYITIGDENDCSDPEPTETPTATPTETPTSVPTSTTTPAFTVTPTGTPEPLPATGPAGRLTALVLLTFLMAFAGLRKNRPGACKAG